MLVKLMKYDLKSMLKVIIPFWIAMFVTGILWSGQVRTALLDMNDGDGTGGLIMGITMMLFLMLITAVIVMNIVVIIQRFWKGLLKEEGYLMFTLPVSERSLVLSKALSSFVITIGTVLVIFLMLIGMGLVNGMNFNFLIQSEFLKQFIHNCGGYSIAFGIVFVFGGIYHLYAAMAIGQLSNRNRFICSFAAYVALAVLFYLLGTPILGKGFHSDVNEWLYVIMGVAEIAVYHAVTEFILTKRLNLE